MIQKLYYFLHHLVLRKQYTVQNFHFMQMLCESSLWSMGYQEHIQQTESHSNGVGQRELTSDHENSTEQNVHLYKLQRIRVYTCWFDHSQLSEIHHAESRKKKKQGHNLHEVSKAGMKRLVLFINPAQGRFLEICHYPLYFPASQ